MALTRKTPRPHAPGGYDCRGLHLLRARWARFVSNALLLFCLSSCTNDSEHLVCRLGFKLTSSPIFASALIDHTQYVTPKDVRTRALATHRGNRFVIVYNQTDPHFSALRTATDSDGPVPKQVLADTLAMLTGERLTPV